MGDLPVLRALMALSIRALIGAYLDAAGVEASFEIMGVDSQLIEDRTYFAVECEGRIAGCGGWSGIRGSSRDPHPTRNTGIRRFVRGRGWLGKAEESGRRLIRPIPGAAE